MTNYINITKVKKDMPQIQTDAELFLETGLVHLPGENDELKQYEYSLRDIMVYLYFRYRRPQDFIDISANEEVVNGKTPDVTCTRHDGTKVYFECSVFFVPQSDEYVKIIEKKKIKDYKDYGVDIVYIPIFAESGKSFIPAKYVYANRLYTALHIGLNEKLKHNDYKELPKFYGQRTVPPTKALFNILDEMGFFGDHQPRFATRGDRRQNETLIYEMGKDYVSRMNRVEYLLKFNYVVPRDFSKCAQMFDQSKVNIGKQTINGKSFMSRDMNKDSRGFGRKAKTPGGPPFDTNGMRLTTSQMLRILLKNTEETLRCFSEQRIPKSWSMVMQAMVACNHGEERVFEKLKEYKLRLTRLKSGVPMAELLSGMTQIEKDKWESKPIKEIQDFVVNTIQKERADFLTTINKKYLESFNISLNKNGLFKVRVGTVGGKVTAPLEKEESDAYFKRKKEQRASADEKMMNDLEGTLTNEERIARKKENKIGPDYCDRVYIHDLNDICYSILHPFTENKINLGNYVEVTREKGDTFEAKIPLGGETAYTGTGLKELSLKLLDEATRNCERVLSDPAIQYMIETWKFYKSYIIALCDNKKTQKRAFGIAHSEGEPWMILGTNPPNEQTSGLIVPIGFHKSRPVYSEYGIPFSYFEFYDEEVGAGYVSITKPMREQLDYILHYEEFLGSMVGLKVMMQENGENLSNGFIDSLCLRQSRQVTLALDIVYLFYKSALVDINFGRSEIQKKIAPIVRKDMRVCYIMDQLDLFFTKMYDDMKEKKFKEVECCLTKTKFLKIQGFLSRVYLKQIIPKNDGYSKDKIMEEGFLTEMGFQSSWEKSPFNPKNLDERVVLRMDEFMDKVLTNDGKNWTDMAYHSGICEAMSQLLALESLNVDPTLKNSLFLNIESITTGKKSRVGVPLQMIEYTEKMLESYATEGPESVRYPLWAKYLNFINKELSADEKLKVKLSTIKDPKQREELLKNATSIPRTLYRGYITVDQVEGIETTSIMNEKIIEKLFEELGEKKTIGDTKLSLSDDAIICAIFFEGDTILIIKDKDQVGYSKRIFFIQTIASRNQNKVIEDYWKRVLSHVDQDLITIAGDEKYIKIERVNDTIYQFSCKSSVTNNGYLTYITKDQTKFGDTMPLQALSASANGLYHAGLMDYQELKYVLYCHEKLKKRRILMPPRMSERIDRLQESVKKIEEIQGNERNYNGFLRSVIEEYNERIKVTSNTDGPFKTVLELRNFIKEVGFVLGVYNNQSSWLSSIAIKFCRKALEEYKLDKIYDEMTQSDDCLGAIGLPAPLAEDFDEITDVGKIIQGCIWDGEIDVRPGGVKVMKFYRRAREDEDDEVIIVKNGVAVTDEFIEINARHICKLIICMSFFSSRLVGQRTSWAKTGIGRSGEVLQAYIYDRRVNIPLLRYTAAMLKDLPGKSPANDLLSAVGRIYPLINNGASENLCATSLLMINYLVGQRYGIAWEDRRLDVTIQNWGIWWCIPSLILTQGFRANLSRLISDSMFIPTIRNHLEIMLDDVTFWKSKKKIREEVGSVIIENDNDIEEFAAVESFKDIKIVYNKKMRALASFDKLAKIMKPKFIVFANKRGISVDFSKSNKDWVREYYSKIEYLTLIPNRDRDVMEIRFLNRYLNRGFQESYARISPAMKLRNKLGYCNRQLINPFTDQNGVILVKDVINYIRTNPKSTESQQKMFKLVYRLNEDLVRYLQQTRAKVAEAGAYREFKRRKVTFELLESRIIGLSNNLNGKDVISAILEEYSRKGEIQINDTRAVNRIANLEFKDDLVDIIEKIKSMITEAGITLSQVSAQPRLFVKLLTNFRVKTVFKTIGALGPVTDRLIRYYRDKESWVIESGGTTERSKILTTNISPTVTADNRMLIYMASILTWLNKLSLDKSSIEGLERSIDTTIDSEVQGNIRVGRYKTALKGLMLGYNLFSRKGMRYYLDEVNGKGELEGYNGIKINCLKTFGVLMVNKDGDKYYVCCSTSDYDCWKLLVEAYRIGQVGKVGQTQKVITGRFLQGFEDTRIVRVIDNGIVEVDVNLQKSIEEVDSLAPWCGENVSIYFSSRNTRYTNRTIRINRMLYLDTENRESERAILPVALEQVVSKILWYLIKDNKQTISAIDVATTAVALTKVGMNGWKVLKELATNKKKRDGLFKQFRTKEDAVNIRDLRKADITLKFQIKRVGTWEFSTLKLQEEYFKLTRQFVIQQKFQPAIMRKCLILQYPEISSILIDILEVRPGILMDCLVPEFWEWFRKTL